MGQQKRKLLDLNRLRSIKFILLFAICASYPAISFADSLFTINTADQPPYSTKDHTGIYDLLVAEIFEKLGVKIKINHLSSARSLENVEVGLDDAEFARIRGLSRTYPNIRIVDEKLIDFAFTAFARNPSIVLSDWNSLKPYHVAFIKGWKIYEMNVQECKSRNIVSSEQELFNMLLNNRVDMILYERLRGIDYMKNNNIDGIHALQSPLAVRGMYLYVNKRNEYMIPKIEKTLKDLKKDGEYQDIIHPFLQ